MNDMGPGDFSKFILPVGRTLHIPGPSTTARDLEDMAYRAERGRAFKPSGQMYLITPDGQTHVIHADGTREIAEIQEMAQAIAEGN